MAWNQINQEVSALCPSEVSLSYSIDGPICRAVNDNSDDDSFCSEPHSILDPRIFLPDPQPRNNSHALQLGEAWYVPGPATRRLLLSLAAEGQTARIAGLRARVT
ncbi:hypothetical protein HZ326_10788 [Fusarium oxysporum f. sp. albedinis]|nr:hypothetical protein HZ326_10788 [Fusarium oxysporum f. sp. albedinis]